MTCHFQNHIQSTQVLCIRDDLTQIRFSEFWQDVHAQSVVIKTQTEQTWALWETDSYEFLVLLFAGLFANKDILIAPHRVKDLEIELAEQGIYFLARSDHSVSKDGEIASLSLDDTFLNQAQVYFYTSGSTGQPKKFQEH